MARRQKEWAARARKRLLRFWKYRCARCGNYHRNFEFDCILPCGHTHHRYDVSQRMSFYRRQFAESNLQILCPPCHYAKTASENPF